MHRHKSFTVDPSVHFGALYYAQQGHRVWICGSRVDEQTGNLEYPKLLNQIEDLYNFM